MEKIEAGLVKTLLDALKKISESLFNYLGASDFEKENIKIDEKNIKKLGTEEWEMPCTYYIQGGGELNFKTKVKLDKDKNLADVTVTYTEDGETFTKHKSKVPGDEYLTESRKMLLSMVSKDMKQSMGIKGSKIMQVTLQRVVGAKETSINLTGIKANYILGEAYSDLDTLLDSDEFTEAITDDPISFEIVEYDDEFDVNPIDVEQKEFTAYSIKQILCATVQFYMDIQLLRWESARNEHLFNVLGSMLYSAQNWVDKLGLWNIEVSDSVCNVLSGCSPDLGANVDVSSDHSPCMDYIGMDYIFPVFDRIINTIEWNYPNLPTDMQQELNWWLRELKRTRDFDLKQNKN